MKLSGCYIGGWLIELVFEVEIVFKVLWGILGLCGSGFRIL
jgi:hypothetical protein